RSTYLQGIWGGGGTRAGYTPVTCLTACKAPPALRRPANRFRYRRGQLCRAFCRPPDDGDARHSSPGAGKLRIRQPPQHFWIAANELNQEAGDAGQQQVLAEN